ncbi:ubiquitin thioesterase OTU1-like [Ruditapes philippinarum]|uniref:ubiquitin thioesterase OTU1-like n=1 Tax=Ruditapes philippinarum TaxID=129788 RepID=UPI00295BD835|nr:ubiquitin thioesterase OTU1-like [Ruditapes philippinarum]
MALNLRCQTKSGQHYLTGLTLSSSVGKLKEMICEATKIPKDCIKVRQGYPPKVIDLSVESNELSSLPFRSGDTLIVEEDSSMRKRRIEQVDKDIQDQITNSGGMLMRKVVPADNSCLFTSVDCVMNNGTVDLNAAPQMRELIAGIVMSDPDTYNEAFLGKGNANYCKWIMNKESWGGAIEISILSKYYDVEIDVVDTQSGRIDRFGEDMNYKQRVLVIYDGIHYDPLIMEPLIPGEEIKTMFSTKDASVLSQAMEIANEAKASRQYTDVAKFTLRCLVCQKSLVGQKEAQEHAKSSGHINFGEY